MTLPPRICLLLSLLTVMNVACSVGLTAGGYWSSSIADGVAAGLTLLFSSVSNLFLHPLATLDGVHLALEHWEVTQGDLLAEWEFCRRAFSADAAGFVGTSSAVVIWVVSSALLAHFLEAVPDWASRRRNGRLSIGPWISRVEFARRAGLMRRARTLLRATNRQSEQRLAARGTGMSAVFRRIMWAAHDIVRGLRRSITEPLPYLVYLLFRLFQRISAFTKAVLRASWRQLAYLLLPVILVFQPWIAWSVDFSMASADARRRLTPVVESYLESIASFPVDELQKRTEMLQSMYAAYREALLVPVSDLDRVLQAQLNTLDDLAAAQSIPDPAVDLRLEVMFDGYARHRLFLGELLFIHSVDEEHGPSAPSRNWLESYVDERTLLSRAEGRARGLQAKGYLTARLGEVDRRLAFETCILRYDVTELLDRPLAREHEYCGTPDAPSSVDEMLRRLFVPGEE